MDTGVKCVVPVASSHRYVTDLLTNLDKWPQVQRSLQQSITTQ